MSEKLHEAAFLAVDLKQLLNNTAGEGSDKEGPILDWQEELDSRLEQNKKLESSERRSTQSIELELFKEFYAEMWGEQYVKALVSLGEPLMKAIKVLKFSELY